jgi:hypothetical protein
MTSGSKLAVLVVLGFLAAVSCSDSSNGSPSGTSSGVPRATKIADLSSAQAGTLCDWVNGKGGGYGRTVTCSDGTDASTDPDKATCSSSAPLLGGLCPTLTVGDLEDCSNAVGMDLCAAATNPACAAFNTCVGT